jgi:hypothetical protein
MDEAFSIVLLYWPWPFWLVKALPALKGLTWLTFVLAFLPTAGSPLQEARTQVQVGMTRRDVEKIMDAADGHLASEGWSPGGKAVEYRYLATPFTWKSTALTVTYGAGDKVVKVEDAGTFTLERLSRMDYLAGYLVLRLGHWLGVSVEF